MMRTVTCSFCRERIDGKTWKRHMRRVHRLSDDQIRMRTYFATIHIPFGMGDRRKLIHV